MAVGAEDEHPSLELIYSGDRSGKVQPCGCPKNPMGHIGRQAAAITAHRASGTPGLYFDLGNTFYESLEVPTVLRQQWGRRAAIIARSMARMKLDFFVPGPTDFAAGLPGFYRLMEEAKTPVLAADLVTESGRQMFPGVLRFQRGDTTVRVVGIAGFRPAVDGVSNREPVAAVQKALAGAEPADITLVASHLDKKRAKALAKAIPGIDAILIADQKLHLIPDTKAGPVVVGSSKEGKHLGILSFYKRGDGPYVGGMRLRRLKGLAAEDEGAATELEALMAGNTFTYKIHGLGEEQPMDGVVAAWVKSYVHFVGKWEAEQGEAPPGYSGDGDFVGSERCGLCHPDALAQWKTTKHSHAYDSLVHFGQQLDRECIGCHTAGWRHPGGFSDPRAVGMLKHVQCESCHGPGKHHAQSGNKAMIIRGKAEAAFCERCHQPDLETGFTEASHMPQVKHWD
tara:strand:- start:2941 stop:4302 length:1362 start_codon:yes stop_codon:yes gene_type:complete